VPLSAWEWRADGRIDVNEGRRLRRGENGNGEPSDFVQQMCELADGNATLHGGRRRRRGGRKSQLACRRFPLECIENTPVVRPGCALYGVNPTPHTRNPMQPVVTLTAPILQIREVTENGTVGYGGTAAVKKGMRLATIGLGYADGYLRSLTDNSDVMIAGKKAKLLGRVSMDLIVADISHLPPKDYTQAEIMNNTITVDTLAKSAGTIGYEVLTRLGSRFTRVYK
jgi:hypothetical protein